MTLSLSTLENLCKEATHGKWRSCKSIHGNRYRYVQFGKDDTYTTLEIEPADADFIAGAQPKTVLALLKVCRAAKRLYVELNSPCTAFPDDDGDLDAAEDELGEALKGIEP